METESFVNLVKKFGNSQKQNIDNMYPYGEFPIEKTKGYNPMESKKVSIQNIETLSSPEVQNSSGLNNIFGSLDIKTLLPLIANMKNKNKFNTYDLFNLLIPTLTKNNPDLKDIIKYFSTNPKPKDEQSSLPPSKMQSIDSYVKA